MLILLGLFLASTLSSAADFTQVDRLRCYAPLKREDCERLIAIHVPLPLLNLVSEVQDMFAEGIRRTASDRYFEGPNCHWFALAYSDDAVRASPMLLNFPEAEQAYIQRGYRPIDREDLRAGDLVLFRSQRRGRFVDEVDGRMIQRTYYFSTLEHSAIFLEGDTILQKENRLDDVFSLGSIEQAWEYWSRRPSPPSQGALLRVDIEYLRR